MEASVSFFELTYTHSVFLPTLCGRLRYFIHVSRGWWWLGRFCYRVQVCGVEVLLFIFWRTTRGKDCYSRIRLFLVWTINARRPFLPTMWHTGMCSCTALFFFVWRKSSNTCVNRWRRFFLTQYAIVCLRMKFLCRHYYPSKRFAARPKLREKKHIKTNGEGREEYANVTPRRIDETR